MRQLPTLLAALALSACAASRPQVGELTPAPPLDELARQYLAVQLAIGEKDPGYVDAYYGPENLKAQAETESAALTLPLLQARVVVLDAALRSVKTEPGTLEAERVRFLRAMLGSAKVRLRMLRGEKIGFEDEAEGLFGVRPELIDLATLDPVLVRIEALVPGDAADSPLGDRVNAFQDRFTIPADRMQVVIDTAVAECRRRTLPNIVMPESESFDLSLVTDKPWSGYNYYKGGYHSVIEINTDVPTRLDRAVDVGCHEAYPGHHVYSTLIERDRVNGLGQIEYTLLPLYSPRAIISEGSAEYGVKLAFPGREQIAYERDVLAPFAGIDASAIEEYYALREAMEDLAPAYYTIAAGYLDGKLSREQAVELSMKYRLQSRARAEQQVRFMDSYRTYVINYGLGKRLVGDFVERGDADEATRWERFIGVLNSPVLPEDLLAGS